MRPGRMPVYRFTGFSRGEEWSNLLSMHRRLLALLSLSTGLFTLPAAAAPVYRDVPFLQAVAARITTLPELQGAAFLRLALDREGIVYVLTDRGVARVFDESLGMDHGYRPLAGKLARDLTVADGELFYLFDTGWLSNGWAGRPAGQFDKGAYQMFAVAADGSVLVAGERSLALARTNLLAVLPVTLPGPVSRLYAWGNQFYVLAGDTIQRIENGRMIPFHRAKEITALAFRPNEMIVGSKRGFYGLALSDGNPTFPLETKLPWPEVTCLAVATNGLWVGTTRGLFLQTAPGRFRYFASKRWLEDDAVTDLQVTPSGDAWVLTRFGLSKIEFRTMTLAQKAAYYEKKIRQRHLRYGFCSELRLLRPGDPASAEMIDTDNDGGWSSYYLASQAFHYAVTGEESARAHAWETFDALERLQTINGLDGFPSRTFERTGFKVSDPDRWHQAPDATWEWKGTTSSDEITSQTFAYAVLYETAAIHPAEKARLAADYDKIIGHIVRHNLYLVDVDNQPTLWGRWHPEYVNRYPPTVGDRRLNSAEIIAFLQFGYRVTGKELYREKALELINRFGYLANITNRMENLRVTPGVEYQGMQMGSEWNHSDDELAFFNYWTLYRYAFNDRLRALYAGAIRDHWELERGERCPVWNFIYGMTGTPWFDLEAGVWTLQRFPLDLVSWTVTNSHRHDLTRLPSNFRGQETEQLLPPDERAIMRWNGNPFTLDGGNGGQTELAGDEFLLPYWMGRYLKFIQ